MNWKRFFIIFLRNIVIIVALTTLVLGGFGWLVAGKEGMLNGASWGLVLGLMGVPFTAFMILTKYWGDYAGRYGAWWVKKESEGEQ